jgi:hypothetical protein
VSPPPGFTVVLFLNALKYNAGKTKKPMQNVYLRGFGSHGNLFKGKKKTQTRTNKNKTQP